MRIVGIELRGPLLTDECRQDLVASAQRGGERGERLRGDIRCFFPYRFLRAQESGFYGGVEPGPAGRPSALADQRQERVAEEVEIAGAVTELDDERRGGVQVVKAVSVQIVEQIPVICSRDER
jgi:hypothetical protein